MNTFASLVGSVLIIGTFIAIGVVASKQQDAQLLRRRRDAMAAFRATSIESDDPRFRFSGATSTVVKEEEFYNRRQPEDGYMLTLFARNEAGEYFMFKATTPHPYVKHVEHRIAKVVLKDAYVPPPGGTGATVSAGS